MRVAFDTNIFIFQDNRILECAVFGKVDLIVTGDKETLRMKEYLGIKISSLRDYLES